MKLNTIFYLLISLLVILNLSNCKQNNSGLIHSNSKDKDSLILKNYLDEANIYIEKTAMDSAENSANQLLEFAQKTENHFYMGKSQAILGYLSLIQHEEDSAYLYLNSAKENFLKTNDSINASKSLVNMAIIQSNQGDYAGSEVVAIQALDFIDDKENIPFKSSVYNSLAISSDARNDHLEAIYWYRKAIEENQDLYSRALYQNNLAVSYLFEQNYTQAIFYLSELMQDSTVLANSGLKSKVIDNWAYTNWKQKPELNIENELNQALEIRMKTKDFWGQIASYAHLSEYFETRNPAISLSYAHKMYAITTELNSPDDRLEALQKLISLESPERSKTYAAQYVTLNDSLVTARNQSQDKFAKIRFDTEQNRAENEILRAETAEQELEIERRKLYVVISISVIILICGGFIGFYRIQKIKNQKRLNDEIHATETKISGKVHDDIANNLYGLMSFIERENEDLDTDKQHFILEKLDEVYQLSRNISRENSPIETGENYPEELLNLFSNYKNENTNVVLIGFAKAPWKNIRSDTKIQFYKVVQELLINMKKHSQASLVVLKFEFNENKFNFFYTDNGIGLSENQMITKNGIQITENRIEKLKGRISFAAEPNKGLKVNVTIPL